LKGKTCASGEFHFDFYVEGNGAVGAVFHYINLSTFYHIYLYGGHTKKFVFFKVNEA
jgi:hypothetical protein